MDKESLGVLKKYKRRKPISDEDKATVERLSSIGLMYIGIELFTTTLTAKTSPLGRGFIKWRLFD